MKNIILWFFVSLDVLKLVLKLRDVFQSKESIKLVLVLGFARDIGCILVRVASLID